MKIKLLDKVIFLEGAYERKGIVTDRTKTKKKVRYTAVTEDGGVTTFCKRDVIKVIGHCEFTADNVEIYDDWETENYKKDCKLETSECEQGEGETDDREELRRKLDNKYGVEQLSCFFSTLAYTLSLGEVTLSLLTVDDSNGKQCRKNLEKKIKKIDKNYDPKLIEDMIELLK